MERRSMVSRELRFWQGEHAGELVHLLAGVVAGAILGAGMAGYALVNDHSKQAHYDYWDAYGCHTDGLTYNATADKLEELPWPCKEYHHFHGYGKAPEDGQ
jgi:hypothetical protein